MAQDLDLEIRVGDVIVYHHNSDIPWDCFVIEIHNKGKPNDSRRVVSMPGDSAGTKFYTLIYTFPNLERYKEEREAGKVEFVVWSHSWIMTEIRHNIMTHIPSEEVLK